MKRYILIGLALLLLTVPLMAVADDQGWMPAEWDPTPPARQSIDVGQLMQLLMTKGLISDQEYVQLANPQSASPAHPGQAKVWTWDEVDNNPVLSSR